MHKEVTCINIWFLNVGLSLLYRSWQKHLIRLYLDAELLDVENMRFYTYRDVRLATEDFNPDNKIGEGGFGSVYKVITNT